MRRSNCILFAVALWWRRWRAGRESYLVIRVSRVRWGFVHLLHGRLDRHTDQLKLVSFKPQRPEKAGCEILFEGQAARGDAKR